MVVRQQIFDTYWRLAAERQSIFFRRIKGDQAPWSQDAILNMYKFCNAYRASDRVSQFLIKEVIYNGIQNEEDVLFRIILFKLFNKIETWQYLVSEQGEISVKNFQFSTYSRVLENCLARSVPIYHNAYMSCATKAYGYDKKHQNHLALVQQMFFVDDLVHKVLKAKSFREVFLLLRDYPLLGDFMAYQLATDINYSEIIDFSENDFTVVGPGSSRGIAKCFLDLQGKDSEYVIRWMQENQEKEFSRLGIDFQSLWRRPLQLIDCQSLFCETDKYCRVAFPELKSNRTRMKSQYRSKYQPIQYFYPPKWGINEAVLALMHT